MAGKRGVSTSVVLAIGIVALTAVVLLVGARIIAPVIFNEPTYVVKDLALTINAMYAAPEDADYGRELSKLDRNFDLSFDKNEICIAEFVEDDDGNEEEVAKSCSKFTLITDKALNCKSVDESSCTYTDSPSKLKLSKKYTEDMSSNEKIEVSA